jgi:hypothetical protein
LDPGRSGSGALFLSIRYIYGSFWIRFRIQTFFTDTVPDGYRYRWATLEGMPHCLLAALLMPRGGAWSLQPILMACRMLCIAQVRKCQLLRPGECKVAISISNQELLMIFPVLLIQNYHCGSESVSYLEGHFGSGSCLRVFLDPNPDPACGSFRIWILVCEIFVKFSHFMSECTL